MKMTAKQRERMIRILEMLKTQGLVVRYRIDGDEVESVVPEWAEGAVDRVCEEILQNLRPFGLRQTDRGWMSLLVPKDRREALTEALLIQANETAKALLREILRGGRGGKEKDDAFNMTRRS
jgi:hypothetical protein